METTQRCCRKLNSSPCGVTAVELEHVSTGRGSGSETQAGARCADHRSPGWRRYTSPPWATGRRARAGRGRCRRNARWGSRTSSAATRVRRAKMSPPRRSGEHTAVHPDGTHVVLPRIDPQGRRRRGHSGPAPLADGPGGAHPHRQGALGPQRDLGHAPQPRLRRNRGLRQDAGRPRGGRAEPHRPPRRPHRPPAGQDAGPAPGGMDRNPGPRPGGRGDLRPGAAAAPGQQAVRLAEHEGPVPAAGHRGLRVLRLRLRLLPHLRDHDRGEQDLLLPCLGSDDYRYQGGRVSGNKPVRADYADQVVWGHVTALLADPALIPAEIGKGWKGPAHRTRSPASAASSSRPSPRPASRSPR